MIIIIKIAWSFEFFGVAFIRGSPEAMAGPTPLMLQSTLAAAWRSFFFCRFLKAFFVSCITTRGVFICTKLTKLGRNLPRYEFSKNNIKSQVERHAIWIQCLKILKHKSERNFVKMTFFFFLIFDFFNQF